MRYNYVMANFWDHAALKKWDFNTSQIALYILTCKHRTSDGLFYLHPNYIKTDLRLRAEEIQSGIEKLTDEDFIRWDKENKIMMITNALKYQPIENIDYKKDIHEHLINLPKTYLYFDLLKKASQYSPSLKNHLLKSMPKEYINDILKLKINKAKESAAAIIKDFADIYIRKEVKRKEKPVKKIKKNNIEKLKPGELKINNTDQQKEKERLNNSYFEIDGEAELHHLIGTLDMMYFDDKKILFTAGLEESSDWEEDNDELDQDFLIKARAHKMTLYLIDAIRSSNKLIWLPEPGSNSSQFKSWIDQIEKLFLIGPIGYAPEENMNFSWEEIRQLIDFSQKDEFWKKEITSAKKLRKHAIQLKISMCQ